MKKCFWILLLCLAGCEGNVPTHNTGDTLPGGSTIETFTYHKHDYIRFGTGNTQSIVHDPDCIKCQKKG